MSTKSCIFIPKAGCEPILLTGAPEEILADEGRTLHSSFEKDGNVSRQGIVGYLVRGYREDVALDRRGQASNRIQYRDQVLETKVHHDATRWSRTEQRREISLIETKYLLAKLFVSPMDHPNAFVSGAKVQELLGNVWAKPRATVVDEYPCIEVLTPMGKGTIEVFVDFGDG